MNPLMMACLLTLGQASEPRSGVYERVVPSAAIVFTAEGRQGSGVLIDARRGLLVTNRHVIGDQDRALVIFAEKDSRGKVIVEASHYVKMYDRLAIRGQIVASDPLRDLAILKLDRLPQGARAIPFARIEPTSGQTVHAIGNNGFSRGLAFGYFSGTVRGVYNRPSASEKLPNVRVIETQMPANAGDSGGPVVNDNGELVGIVAGSIDPEMNENINISIAVGEIQVVLAKIGRPEAIESAPPLADPTAPSEKIRRILQGPSGTPGEGPNAAPAIPTIILKGRILGGFEPSAILEVDGAMQHVRKNSVLSSGGATLRVLEITAEGVKIEIKPVNETIIVN